MRIVSSVASLLTLLIWQIQSKCKIRSREWGWILTCLRGNWGKNSKLAYQKVVESTWWAEDSKIQGIFSHRVHWLDVETARTDAVFLVLIEAQVKTVSKQWPTSVVGQLMARTPRQHLCKWWRQGWTQASRVLDWTRRPRMIMGQQTVLKMTQRFRTIVRSSESAWEVKHPPWMSLKPSLSFNEKLYLFSVHFFRTYSN